jgi:hypothetical protein
MVVTVKDNRHTVVREQVVNRLLESESVLVERVGAVEIMPSPFKECGCFGPTSCRFITAADQIVDEDELEPRSGKLIVSSPNSPSHCEHRRGRA